MAETRGDVRDAPRQKPGFARVARPWGLVVKAAWFAMVKESAFNLAVRASTGVRLGGDVESVEGDLTRDGHAGATRGPQGRGGEGEY